MPDDFPDPPVYPHIVAKDGRGKSHRVPETDKYNHTIIYPPAKDPADVDDGKDEG